MLKKAFNILKSVVFWGLLGLLVLIIAAACAVFLQDAEHRLQRSCDIKELEALRLHGKEALRGEDEKCFEYKERLEKINHREVEELLDAERKKVLD